MLKEESLSNLTDKESPTDIDTSEKESMASQLDGLKQISPGHYVHPDHVPWKHKPRKKNHDRMRKSKQKQAKKSRKKNRRK